MKVIALLCVSAAQLDVHFAGIGAKKDGASYSVTVGGRPWLHSGNLMQRRAVYIHKSDTHVGSCLHRPDGL